MLRKQALSNISITVPKNRKPKFELTLRIYDLTNIPLICGTAYVKWHLPSSSAAEHRGKTERALIRDHKATWDYLKELTVRLTIEKTQLLQECDIHFEILQEYHDGGKGGRVHLGNVKLNLAEYTQVPEVTSTEKDPTEDVDEGSIIRRYLMQDSKINSTLKVGIKMKQIEGDTNFIAPPLKSAMVIGGIAALVSAEAGEHDDMPNISSKTRELSEAQDIYRRNLAASWACQNGEMPPDKLIEDLFAGGDGGRVAPKAAPWLQDAVRITGRDESMHSSSSDADSRRTIMQGRHSPDPSQHHHHHHHHHQHKHHRGGDSNGSSTNISQSSTISGRTSLEQQIQQNDRGHRHHNRHKDYQELTEFDLREDLKSWQVRVS